MCPDGWESRGVTVWEFEELRQRSMELERELQSAIAATIEECKRIVIEEGPRAYPNIDRIVKRLDALASTASDKEQE